MTDVDEMHRGSRRRGWRVAVWGGATLLFLLPVVAARLTHEVSWDGVDYLVFGALLLGACGAAELLIHLARKPRVRWMGALAIMAVFILVWAQLAVGIV